MFKKGDIIELEIEKLVFEGYGLARKKVNDLDFVIFVENGKELKNNDYICGRITDDRYE